MTPEFYNFLKHIFDKIEHESITGTYSIHFNFSDSNYHIFYIPNGAAICGIKAEVHYSEDTKSILIEYLPELKKDGSAGMMWGKFIELFYDYYSRIETIDELLLTL